MSFRKGRPVVHFTVYGEAQPAGSKRAFVVKGRAVVTDDNKRSKPWKAAVSAEAGEAMQGIPMLLGPVALELRFYRTRPKGHYGTGRNAAKIKASAPRHPTSKPDVLKLARGVEDALTGIVYRDDAQIVDERLSKGYGPGRVEITVWDLAPTEAAP